MTAIICPPWHFLPGPYEDDPERTECPHRGTHKDQRKTYDERNPP